MHGITTWLALVSPGILPEAAMLVNGQVKLNKTGLRRDTGTARRPYTGIWTEQEQPWSEMS